jgi:hypothetical protein
LIEPKPGTVAIEEALQRLESCTYGSVSPAANSRTTPPGNNAQNRASLRLPIPKKSPKPASVMHHDCLHFLTISEAVNEGEEKEIKIYCSKSFPCSRLGFNPNLRCFIRAARRKSAPSRLQPDEPVGWCAMMFLAEFDDLFIFNEGNHFRLHEKLEAIV